METILFYGLLGLSVVSAAIYLTEALLHSDTAKRPRIWRRFCVMLLIPVAGPCYFAVSELIYRAYYARKPLAMVKPAEKAAEVVALPDTDDELNVVSIEEAMIVSHKSDLRRLLLNLLKDGADNSIGAISLALDSDDSEASHYSASAIADSLARFHERVRMLTEQLDLDEDNAETLTELVDYMLWYLGKKILSDREQRMYLAKVSDYLDRLIEAAPTTVSSAFFSQMTEQSIDVHDLELAGRWAKRCAELFPDSLDAYSANLHYCYAVEDSDGFRRWLDALKHSKVIVNKQMLDLIHTFS